MMMILFTSRSSSGRFPSYMPCATVISVWILIRISTSEVVLLQDQYIGCFYDDDIATDLIAPLPTGKAVSIENCSSMCQKENTTYSALQNGSLCHCRNDYGVQLGQPDSDCYLICSGNENQICGGFIGQRITYSLYAVCPIGTYGAACDKGCHCKRDIPCERMNGNCPDGCYGNWSGPACNITTASHRYIECYKDTYWSRAMEFQSSDNTVDNSPQSCSKACAEKNYSYAGLAYYFQCFCGENYDRYGPSTACDKPCPGDNNTICGGSYANSVYSVCPIGNYGKSCTRRCHCYNDGRCIYRNGSCPPSQCEPGWTGTSCNIRDCTQNNGGCSINETCYAIDLTYSNVYVCRCSNGFQRTSLLDSCTDTDECSLNVCDADTMSCTNTIGSYNCSCRSGFQTHNATACIDIDECIMKVCAPNTTACTNTIGSYKCSCRSGFQAHNSTACKEFEEHSTATSIGAVVGSISAVVIVVTIAFSFLFCYRRNRQKKSSQDNELQQRASANETNRSSSHGNEEGLGIDCEYMSIVEDSSHSQFPERGDVYASLTAAKFRNDESRIYAHLANAKVSAQK